MGQEAYTQTSSAYLLPFQRNVLCSIKISYETAIFLGKSVFTQGFLISYQQKITSLYCIASYQLKVNLCHVAATLAASINLAAYAFRTHSIYCRALRTNNHALSPHHAHERLSSGIRSHGLGGQMTVCVSRIIGTLGRVTDPK